MKVLIIGSTGTEHAIALNIALSPRLTKLYCCPGNPGISEVAECIDIKEHDFNKLSEFIKEKEIDLVIPLSSALFEQGIVDFLQRNDINVLGPNKDLAQLETSKYFAKEFTLRREIPGTRYAAFDKREYAIAYLKSQKLPLVIKANGITHAQGITIVNSYEGGIGAINACFEGKFGPAGNKVIIEEYIPGHEVSLTAIVDSEGGYAILPSVKKYKRLYDNDTGPNTEGVGAICPHPESSPGLLDEINQEIIQPIIQGLKEEGRLYSGIMNFEIVIDEDNQAHIIDLNISIDPLEAAVSPLLLESDILETFDQASKNGLNQHDYLPSAEHSGNTHAIAAALCSDGYPGETARNLPVRFQATLERQPYSQLTDITGELDLLSARFILLHNSTDIDQANNLITGSGRIFIGTALAGRSDQAQKALYRLANKIDFPGKRIRYDIGST